MELSGLPLGMASKGSFGPDPFAGMFTWDLEMIVWIDDTLGIEVVDAASGKTNFAHRLAAHWTEAEAFARATGFPEHRQRCARLARAAARDRGAARVFQTVIFYA